MLNARRAALAALLPAVLLGIVQATGFTFLEDDSVLYSQVSAAMARADPVPWLSPQWPSGRWKSGLFQEHAAVFFWPAVVCGRLGLSTIPAILLPNFAYIAVAVLAGFSLLRRRSGPEAAHLFAWMFLLAPGPLTYILRGNHESALVAGLLVAVWAFDRLGERAAWGVVAALACAWCVLIKGVVGMLVLPALGLWWLVHGGGVRGALALGGCAASVLATVAVYDAAFAAANGHSFVQAYLEIHLGYAVQKEEVVQGSKLKNLGFYLVNALWLCAPWSLVLPGMVVRRFRGPVSLPASTWAGLACTAFIIAFLSMFDRKSIRYAYAMVPFVAVACAPLLVDLNARLRTVLARARPWLPEAWMAAAVVVTWLRIWVHQHAYSYISTQ